jgi:hypothetical protein
LSFCTVVNCIDGRVQLPVIEYLRKRLGVPYVDSVTEPGPVLTLAEDPTGAVAESILNRVAVSQERHGSTVVSVVAHGDCGGNPACEETQREQLLASVELLAERFPRMTVMALWVDEDWRVREVTNRPPG